MSLSYSFTDNVIYGTEDINAITKDLTGAGIAPFPTQNTYNVSDLNALTEALVSSGVSLDGCLCSKTEDTVMVAEGIIFFENGVHMRVDSEGYSLTVSQNQAGYVYAYFNPSSQEGGIEFSAAIPQEVYCVPLAEISAEGEMRDTRAFAQSKVASFGKNIILETEFAPINPPIQEPDDNGYHVITTRRLENADISKFNYAFIQFTSFTGLFDIKKNIFILTWKSTEDYTRFNTNQIYSEYSRLWLYVLVKDGTLVVQQQSEETSDKYSHLPISVTLI